MGVSYMTRRQANTAILAGAAVLVAAPASATQETEPIRRPDGTVLAPHHGHRRLRGYGERRMAL